MKGRPGTHDVLHGPQDVIVRSGKEGSWVTRVCAVVLEKWGAHQTAMSTWGRCLRGEGGGSGSRETLGK